MPNSLMRIALSRKKIDVLKNSIALARYHNIFTPGKNENEVRIRDALLSKFPKARVIEVQDISGGCGAMYDITVQASEFKGLSIVKQHKLVTQALKEEIKEMHGLRINTVAS